MFSKCQHEDFILAPLRETLQDALYSANFLKGGIEEFPIKEHFLQSLFLKLTGAQEQKLKCICWEIANRDYEYRRKYPSRIAIYGECSKIDAKNGVYVDLYESSQRLGNTLTLAEIFYNYFFTDKKREELNLKFRELKLQEDVAKARQNGREFSDEELQERRRNMAHLKETVDFMKDESERYILDKTRIEVTNFAKSESVNILLERDLELFEECSPSLLNQNNFSPCAQKIFFNTALDIYNSSVYMHRNRCAHNTLSYQSNLPTLAYLADKNNKYCNYCFRFYYLLIIDELIIALFDYYKDLYVL